MTDVAVSIQSLSHRYGKTLALDDVSLEIPRGATVGLIGPDGVGKSTLLSLTAGVKTIQTGTVSVLGGDMADKAARLALSHRIAFMPQGLGKNLYPTLSVAENIDFHARLFGLNAAERRQRIARLVAATGLAPFTDRAAGKLSGGMKQKLSLCCALVHNPDLLILDEPTTGVDPLSRRQFWTLVSDLRAENPGMTVIVATAYIEEAQQFAHLLAMDDSKLLVSAPTAEVLQRYDTQDLETAYVQMLPEEKRQGSGMLEMTPFAADPHAPPAMEAHGLTKRFGDFTAVDHVSFTIEKGEIFGFLGSNGCGKSTTMKMLTGLLPATEGTAELLGHPLHSDDTDTRMRVGYMSQAFSLYEELTVRQNLDMHARLYRLGGKGAAAVDEAMRQFDLADVADAKPASLPLGIRQRLQLAAACLHRPEVLILDEPTSGVDPAARDMFWRHLLKLSREDKITIFVSTHFMNEAERCDRISLMNRGRVLAVGTPPQLVRQFGVNNLEEAFIRYLEEDEGHDSVSATVSGSRADTGAETAGLPENTQAPPPNGGAASAPNRTETANSPRPATAQPQAAVSGSRDTQSLKYWFAMVYTFAKREGNELLRDKIRLFFAVFGPLIMMAAVSWGVSFDVQNLKFAVYDRDQSVQSREFTEYFSGSRYFIEQPPLHSEADIDHALQSSKAMLVIDIPNGFGRDVQHGRKPEVGFYIDGTMPFNASNIRAYVGSMVSAYTLDKIRASGLPIPLKPPAAIAPRFMYNQDFNSINAIAPGVMMMVLMMIPAMMAAVGVVREKEVGSIANFYASPASVPQYLIGKQLPYIAMGMVNFAAMLLMMLLWFQVPLKGSFWALLSGTVLMVGASTALGLLVSCFVRSQLAAIFAAAIISMIPTMNFSGFLYPMSTLSDSARTFGYAFPSSWYLNITLGTFPKSLSPAGLLQEYAAIAVFTLVVIGMACLLLKKQEK